MTNDIQNAQTVNAIAIETSDVTDFISSLSAAQSLTLNIEGKVADLKKEISDTKSKLKASVASYAEGSKDAEPVDIEAQKDLISDINFKLNQVKAQLKLLKSVAKAYNSFQFPEQK